MAATLRLPDDQIRCICEGCKRGLELVHNGNERSALFTAAHRARDGRPASRHLGTDAPAGSGVQPSASCAWYRCCHRLGELPAESPSSRHRQYRPNA